jgi:hypothetical protein
MPVNINRCTTYPTLAWNCYLLQPIYHFKKHMYGHSKK